MDTVAIYCRLTDWKLTGKVCCGGVRMVGYCSGEDGYGMGTVFARLRYLSGSQDADPRLDLGVRVVHVGVAGDEAR